MTKAALVFATAALAMSFNNVNYQIHAHAQENEIQSYDPLDNSKYLNIKVNNKGFVTGFLDDNKCKIQTELHIPGEVYIPFISRPKEHI